jgi:N-acetylated-alpha-linked acidic dipeptidase
MWLEKFGDPGFRYHAAMSRLWGVLALRLANADVVPLDYRQTAARLREFAAEVAKRQPADAASFGPLQSAIDRFASAADAFGRQTDDALVSGRLTPEQSAAASNALMRVERAFLSPSGIPGRPWYRHLMYAPKPTYAPEVLPGIAEASEAGDRSRLAEQVSALVKALDRASAVLKR